MWAEVEQSAAIRERRREAGRHCSASASRRSRSLHGSRSASASASPVECLTAQARGLDPQARRSGSGTPARDLQRAVKRVLAAGAVLLMSERPGSAAPLASAAPAHRLAWPGASASRSSSRQLRRPACLSSVMIGYRPVMPGCARESSRARGELGGRARSLLKRGPSVQGALPAMSSGRSSQQRMGGRSEFGRMRAPCSRWSRRRASRSVRRSGLKGMVTAITSPTP